MNRARVRSTVLLFWIKAVREEGGGELKRSVTEGFIGEQTIVQVEIFV